jgi:hypothetical protein
MYVMPHCFEEMLWQGYHVYSTSDNTLGVTPRTLRVLARHAVKVVVCEGPGNPLRRASPGCAGFVNRGDVICNAAR